MTTFICMDIRRCVKKLWKWSQLPAKFSHIKKMAKWLHLPTRRSASAPLRCKPWVHMLEHFHNYDWNRSQFFTIPINLKTFNFIFKPTLFSPIYAALWTSQILLFPTPIPFHLGEKKSKHGHFTATATPFSPFFSLLFSLRNCFARSCSLKLILWWVLQNLFQDRFFFKTNFEMDSL